MTYPTHPTVIDPTAADPRRQDTTPGSAAVRAALTAALTEALTTVLGRRAGDASVTISGDHLVVLGDSNAAGHGPVATRIADLLYHVHLIGPTGAGKSTLIAHLALQDITARRALALLEPRGDLTRDLLTRIPPNHRDRLVLIDPDTPHTAPRLALLDPHHPLSVEHLVGICASLYHRHWGPRIEEALRNACLTLIHHYHHRAAQDPHHPHPHLGDLIALFTNPAYRRRVTTPLTTNAAHGLSGGLGGGVGGGGGGGYERVEESLLASYWTDYDQASATARAEATRPLLTRLRSLLLRPLARRLLTGTGPAFNPTHLLAHHGILLARLAEAALGADTTALIGSLLVAQLWTAATARAHQPPTQRPPAALYLDECHTFLHMPIRVETLLTQTRALGLGCVLAHQHRAQLPPELWEALGANAHNKIIFRVSPDDARALEHHVTPDLSAYDLAHLPPYTAALRLIHHNHHLPTCTVTTRPLPPTPQHPERGRRERGRRG